MLYPTDVSDKEWAQIKEFFEQKKKFGRPLSYDRRNMVNAIFYVTKTGCQWRMLPNDFPAWFTVYSLFFWLKPPSSDGRDFSPCLS